MRRRPRKTTIGITLDSSFFSESTSSIRLFNRSILDVNLLSPFRVASILDELRLGTGATRLGVQVAPYSRLLSLIRRTGGVFAFAPDPRLRMLDPSSVEHSGLRHYTVQ
jgi:hypothetical protein